MKSRPILYSAPMVRPVLSGMKTQTRRICKNQPYGNGIGFVDNEYLCHNDYLPPSAMLMDVTRRGRIEYTTSNLEGWEAECPYGLIGDQLWGRETHFAWGRWETRYSAKKGRDEWHFIDMTLECGKAYLYPATDPQPQPMGGKKHRGGMTPTWWKRPAIFMPRAASRITLEITGVRLERLQDISEADAVAEGIEKAAAGFWSLYGQAETDGTYSPIASYRALWESINGQGSWDMNPWVWELDFRRIT